jgi:hypothetical protein
VHLLVVLRIDLHLFCCLYLLKRYQSVGSLSFTISRLFSIVHRGNLDYVRTEFIYFINVRGYKYRLLSIGAVYLVTRLSFVCGFCDSFWKHSEHRNKSHSLPCTCYYNHYEKKWNIIFTVNAVVCLHDLHCPATWVELHVSKEIVRLFNIFKPIEIEPVWRISQVILRQKSRRKDFSYYFVYNGKN